MPRLTPAEFQKLLEEAQEGNAIAQFQLGNCYRLGDGVARDDVQAVTWYLKAAEQNIVEAHDIADSMSFASVRSITE